jgi:hypothetical protein
MTHCTVPSVHNLHEINKSFTISAQRTSIPDESRLWLLAPDVSARKRIITLRCKMGDFRINALYAQARAYADQFQPHISDADAKVRCFINSYFAALTPWGYIQNQLPSTERIYAIVQTALLGIACAGLIISVGLWCVGRTQLMVVTAVLSCASAAGAFMAYQAASLATYSQIAKDLEGQVKTLTQNNTTFQESNAALQKSNTAFQESNAALQQSNTALQQSVNQSEEAVKQLRLQLAQYDALLKEGRALLDAQAQDAAAREERLSRFHAGMDEAEQVRKALANAFEQDRARYTADQNALIGAMRQLVQTDLATSVKKTQEALLAEAKAVGQLEVTQKQLSTTQQQLEATHRKFAETVETLQRTGQYSASTAEALAQILKEAQDLLSPQGAAVSQDPVTRRPYACP